MLGYGRWFAGARVRRLGREPANSRTDEPRTDEPRTTDGHNTSDTFEEGDARQDGPGPVPGPRAPARHPGQPARLRPREVTQYPQRRAGRSKAAVRGLGGARDAGRARDAVPV